MTSTGRTEQKSAAGRKPPTKVEKHGYGMQMHTYRTPVTIPYFTPKDLAANTKAVTSVLPAALPPAKDIIFYGGLGVLAAAEAIEWPVALAIAGATWVVRSRRKGAAAPHGDAQSGKATG